MAYLGIPPFGGKTSRTVTERVATAGQTTFYPDGGYVPGYIDVYFNGAHLNVTDFTATDTQSVVLDQACQAGDELKFVSYNITLSPNTTHKRATFTATQGQTTFSIGYLVGYVDVYLNGIKLVDGSDYTATTGTNIVLLTAAQAGDTVDVLAIAETVLTGSGAASSAYGWFMQ